VADGAIAALEKHWDGDGKPVVRLEIDRQYRTSLFFDEPRDDDLVMDHERFTLLADRSTARRADGLVIDWVDSKKGAGFKIDNPNEPPRVRPLSVTELKRWMDEGKPMEIFDVRTPEERGRAVIDGTVLLDERGKERLEALDRSTVLVMQCHHGHRSQVAAEHCIRMGFSEVYNLEGGIDAWSLEVDETVPRY
jgi:monothiol glutaredoxin